MDLFYNKVTLAVVDYAGLKALYTTGISWPASSSAGGVTDRIADTNPPNLWLGTHPTLADWERLYRDAEPTGIKIWEINELNAAFYNSGTSRWEQTWTTRARSGPEMLAVNLQVADIAKNLRDARLWTEINYNDIYTDSTEGTRGAISDLIEYLMSEGEDISINWKGSNDINGMARWAEANISDLQQLSVLVTEFQQKAFTAERQTVVQHMEIEFFDYYEDVETFYIDVYDNL